MNSLSSLEKELKEKLEEISELDRSIAIVREQLKERKKRLSEVEDHAFLEQFCTVTAKFKYVDFKDSVYQDSTWIDGDLSGIVLLVPKSEVPKSEERSEIKICTNEPLYCSYNREEYNHDANISFYVYYDILFADEYVTRETIHSKSDTQYILKHFINKGTFTIEQLMKLKELELL